MAASLVGNINRAPTSPSILHSTAPYLCRHLQQQALLRVQHGCLARRHAERGGIKVDGISAGAAGSGVGLRTCGRVGVDVKGGSGCEGWRWR